MACAICNLPMQNHQPALRVLGELPLETVKSVLMHQWRKDVARIVYAHAEYYHDQTIFEWALSQDKQLNALDEDLKRHRAKYIMHYLHAVVEAHRHDEVGPTRVTMENETIIRLKLEEALDYRLPNDLDAVFRQAKPIEWKGTMAWDQVRRCQDEARATIERSNYMLGRGYVQEVIDRRLVMVISIAVRLCDDESSAIPKAPDPLWCWNQTTKQIEEFQSMTMLDLF
ncbi:hypothetical protein F4861DRAFT_158753 [Xylaria intraflava]|nr:hypothetical protein F4861DRAFT_158753 [Xylaria intraflava]